MGLNRDMVEGRHELDLHYSLEKNRENINLLCLPYTYIQVYINSFQDHVILLGTNFDSIHLNPNNDVTFELQLNSPFNYYNMPIQVNASK